MLKNSLIAFVLGLIPFAPSVSASTITQRTSVLDLGSGTPIPNSMATITRTNQWIDLNLNTTQLNEGAYTQWWVIFNNPEFCLDGCGEDDFFRTEVDATAFYGDGQIIDNSGIGSFSSAITIGILPTEPDQVLFGNGLMDAFGSEIQAIVRYHGPINPDPTIAALQTTTFNGGCNLTPGDGLFDCVDEQIATFQAVPEPSLTLGLMFLGLRGLAFVFQQKTKKAVSES